MMKKFFVLITVLVLLAATALPALAGEENGDTWRHHFGYPPESPLKKGDKMPFALSGTIASLDEATGTVTVTVACGNTQVKSYYGQDVTLQTNSSTRFLLRVPGTVAIPIAFADLKVGDKVSAQGLLADSVWTATRITTGASLNCAP